MMRGMFTWSCAVGVVAFICGCGQPLPAGLGDGGHANGLAAEQPADSVDSAMRVATIKPGRKTLVRRVEQPGEIQAFEQTPLHSKVTGYVSTVHVDIGDNVKLGQLLVEISIPEYEQELKQKQALVAQAAAIEPIVNDPFPGYDAQAKVDPTGTWTWQRRFGRNPVSSTLRLAMTDGKLEGTLETRRGDQEPAAVDIQSPILEGNKLLFDVTQRFGDREFTASYQGIVGKDGIRGWQLMEFNGAPRDSEWRATRENE